jgi:hypothetical protein
MPSKSRYIAKRKNAKERVKSDVRAPYIVFISHSSKDLWIVKMMTEKIHALGAKVWIYEKDLQGGDVIIDKIFSGIKACNEAIVLVSSDSINSHWVIGEIGAVLAHQKRLTPILNHTKPDDIDLLKGVTAIMLNDFEQFLSQLKDRIKQHKQN